MKRQTYIWVTSSFVALHRWADAPAEVSFLRSFHRHVFNVKVHLPVTHSDRDIEFFTFKKVLDDFLQKKFAGGEHDKSCEMFAEEILNSFPVALSVQVDEDGENGAMVVNVADE